MFQIPFAQKPELIVFSLILRGYVMINISLLALLKCGSTFLVKTIHVGLQTNI